MAELDAVELALALYRAPRNAEQVRRQPLPKGMTLLLRVAGGDGAALLEAAGTGARPQDITEAARFFVQQALFWDDRDPYRVLGVRRDADLATIKEHHRLLIRFLHPDRSDGTGMEVYAERINRAWNALRTPERRADTDTRLERASSGPSEASVPDIAPAPIMARPNLAPAAPARPLPNLGAWLLGSAVVLAVLTVGWVWLETTQVPPETLVDADAASPPPSTQAEPATRADTVAPAPTDTVASAQAAATAPALAPAGTVDAPESLPAAATDTPGMASAAAPPTSMPAAPLPESATAPAPAIGATGRAAATAQAEADESPAAPVAGAPAAGAPALAATTPVSPAATDRAALPPARAPRTRPADSAPSERGAEASASTAAVEPPARSAPAPSHVAAASPPARNAAPEPAAGSPSAGATAAPESVAAAATPAPPEPRRSIERRQAEAVLAAFSVAYARGDLPGLLSLFSADARNNRGDLVAIAEDYEQFFAGSGWRSIDFADVQLIQDDSGATATAYFAAQIKPLSKSKMVKVSGRIQFDLRKDAGRVVIARLLHEEAPRAGTL
jgi:hypothetical protein